MASAQCILYAIPAEILCEIISSLDPIALIALSQASKSLRNFINPIEHDFQQRLLALELLPKYGGAERDLEPESPELARLHTSEMRHRGKDWWASNKYACCGCMKILSHSMFDDDDLFDTTTRKPWATGPETRRMAFTDWKPTNTTDDRLFLIQRQASQDARATEQCRQRYEESISWFKRNLRWSSEDDDENTWDDVTMDDSVDDEAIPKHLTCVEETAPLIVGKARHKRRCIECKFRRNLYSNLLCGDSNAPIVTCHDAPGINITSSWLFPGLLPNRRAPETECRSFMAGPRNWDYDGPRILRIRCPGCEKWQRSRAFGTTLVEVGPWRSSVNGAWRDSAIKMDQSSPLCHYCHVKTHGKAATAARLTEVALDVLGKELDQHLNDIRGLKRTWEKVATLSGDPHGWSLQKDLDWRQLAPSSDHNFLKPIHMSQLPTLLARKRLVQQSLAPIFRELGLDGPIPFAYEITCSEVERDFDYLRRFLQPDHYEFHHQTVLDMKAAYDKILEAKSTGNHDVLLNLVMAQDEYGRKLQELAQLGDSKRLDRTKYWAMLYSGSVMDETGTKLLGLLDGLPLALAQAASYLRETRLNIASYVRLYKQQWDDLMRFDGESSLPLVDYEQRSVGTTWTMSFKAIKARNEKVVLDEVRE
ncbi:hypothetical protein B0T21DRAFT_406062 [Apiosordaria backusii]|uniref:F-box domain-containing protein n=1 Tax=Apiosordaria backusii TaxID=314023 RepID=A0AA40EXM7_9PEZI|nr:hypothetical protein B0T21DRAFT_406062 [Apiosordaria backusii]